MSPRTPEIADAVLTGNVCPNDETLVDYVDKALPSREAAKVAGHVRRCSRCQKTARRELRWSEAIHNAFALLAPCPDSEQLAALVDGGLSGKERKLVEQHVTLCPECHQHVDNLRRMEQNEEMLDDSPPEFLEAALSAPRRPVVKPIHKAPVWSGAQVQRSVERLRELFKIKQISLVSRIQAVPPWVEERPAEFQRRVIGFVLIAFRLQANSEVLMVLTHDKCTIEAAGGIAEVREGGETLLRTKGGEERWDAPYEMYWDRIQRRNVRSLGDDVRIPVMLATTIDELQTLAASVHEKPSKRDERHRLRKSATTGQEHNRLSTVQDLRHRLRESLGPKEGETTFPAISLDADIQQAQSIFANL